ncbi:Protein of unknown function [Gryllus bimaculatus]|nr:Protein of unknown function [Gryllus bimaculatus]
MGIGVVFVVKFPSCERLTKEISRAYELMSEASVSNATWSPIQPIGKEEARDPRARLAACDRGRARARMQHGAFRSSVLLAVEEPAPPPAPAPAPAPRRPPRPRAGGDAAMRHHAVHGAAAAEHGGAQGAQGAGPSPGTGAPPAQPPPPPPRTADETFALETLN